MMSSADAGGFGRVTVASLIPYRSAFCSQQQRPPGRSWSVKRTSSSAFRRVLSLKVGPPVFGRAPLDGVPEHRAGDGGPVAVKECFEDRPVLLADLPEHPARRLVDRVFLIPHEQLA